MTQLPSLFGVAGGGHNFFERVALLVGELGQIHFLVLAIGLSAIAALLIGERVFPGRPVALVIVVLAIVAASFFGLAASGVPITGKIPEGLPSLAWPSLRLHDVDEIFPLAAGCLLLAYVEGVSAARTFAAKHGYDLDSRQEFLGIGAANLAAALGHGYPVAGGLSQSAVNDKAGAKTPLSLIFASTTLALCLLFLTGFLENLPKAVLAAVVFTAVIGLVDLPMLHRMWRISKMDFLAAAIALAAVLLFGILQGMLIAAAASVLMLVARASQPHVAFLGRVPGTNSYSDIDRHPENEALTGLIAFRPESSLLYVNADTVLDLVLHRISQPDARQTRTVVCDLSASPFIDLAGTRMLHRLHAELASRHIALRIVGARARVRDLLRADGVGDKVGGVSRFTTLDKLLASLDAPANDAA
jgi:MFS superfamily sulfate permease-like transporter